MKSVFCLGSPEAKNTSIRASVRFVGIADKPCVQGVFCRMAKDVRLGFAKPGDSFGGKVTLVTFSTVSVGCTFCTARVFILL